MNFLFGNEDMHVKNFSLMTLNGDDLDQAMPVWERWIGAGFLPDKMKADYLLLLKTRWGKLL